MRKNVLTEILVCDKMDNVGVGIFKQVVQECKEIFFHEGGDGIGKQ
jgi:hypothetical protein